jgi:hypothetical protein
MNYDNERFITAETEGLDEAVRIKNEIQIALLQRHINDFNFTFDQFNEWKEKYSARFQRIFDRMIKADPHFWLHDQQTRDATLTMFEDELYEEEGKINPEKEAERFEDK